MTNRPTRHICLVKILKEAIYKTDEHLLEFMRTALLSRECDFECQTGNIEQRQLVYYFEDEARLFKKNAVQGILRKTKKAHLIRVAKQIIVNCR